HAFTGHVTGDRRVIRLARDLVDFVNVDNTGLRLLDVVVALLQQLLNDVLDVLANITRLGERGGVSNRERDVEQASERFGKERLAAARRADQQDVALGDLDIVLGARATRSEEHTSEL